MRTKALVGRLVALMILLAGPCRADPDFEAARSNSIAMELLDGYVVVVRGKVGSAENLRFVLDTGVTHSVLSFDVLRTLGISESPKVHGAVLNFDRRLPVEWVTVENVEVGPIRIPELALSVGDLKYFRSFAGRVDGVIGLDVLSRASFTIDFSARKVLFGMVAHPPGQARIHSVRMRKQPGYYTIELVAEDQPLEVIVDSGLRGIVLYEDRLSKRSVAYRLTGDALGLRMGGLIRGNLALLPRLSVNGRGVDPNVVLTPAPSGGGSLAFDGYFGLASLRARRVTFDFEQDVLTWAD
jgi:hypothetical protein